MDQTLTIIMAGGQGTRLSVLANRRAKPAVPFCGIYRIIDFALSNAMHSGARCVGIVTQYRPYSLVDHVSTGEWWGLEGFDRVVKILSPHTGENEGAFYSNTADAIYHNIEFIERFPKCTEVLLLSGDHIYEMDYRPMLELHRRKGAALTIACQEVPWEDTPRFGIMAANEEGRITKFQEKPKTDPLSNMASLGIYVFNTRKLIEALKADQVNPESSHDFGHDVIPHLIRNEPVYMHPFSGYWRDVGTVEAYLDTSMAALDPDSGLDIKGWGVRTNHREIPLSAQHATHVTGDARTVNSLLSKGATIEGEVVDSIVSPGVHVAKGAKVHGSILLHDVKIGEGAMVNKAILDKGVRVGDNAVVGDPEMGDKPNERFPHLLSTGITLLGKFSRIDPGVRIGQNSLVYPRVTIGGPDKQLVPPGSTFFFDEN